MPPLALVRCTTRSVLTRMSAPSMAPTPVTSSMTPTLIGVPVGAPPAAGAVVAAGLEHAARIQQTDPTSNARWLRVGAAEVIFRSLPNVFGLRVAAIRGLQRFPRSVQRPRLQALRRYFLQLP